MTHATVEPKSIRITGQTPGPRLLITGGVHGDEFEGMAAIRRLAEMLTPDQLSGTLVLVPVANEPAYSRGHRCGPDDLDLARSFPGSSTGSVTQQIAHALTRMIAAADGYIDLHTGGTTLQLVPLVGYMLHADASVLDRQRHMARAFNVPVIWGTTAQLEGRSLSAARDARVPAIYAEWGGGGRCDPEGIRAYVEGCLNVMGAMGMLRRDPPASMVRHLVEDPREHSGHLQVQHPAPADGFFEPAVALGQFVRQGDCLGAVVDPSGGSAQPIRATHAGMVLCLRTCPRVRKTDSLAVVLEIGEVIA